MYTLVVLTKKRGNIVTSFDAQFRAMLKFKAFDLLTPHRMAVILKDGEVDLIYELDENGVPKEVTDKYEVTVEFKEVV